jgi:hypothetical protein
LPLFDGLPTGNDAVTTGPREVSWRSDAAATLAWVEAQDGGDPARAAEVRDVLYVHAAPFAGKPAVLARLGKRVEAVYWGRGDTAIVVESWWKDRSTKRWRVAPDGEGVAPALLFSGSYEDRYADPGVPVTYTDEHGHERLLMDGTRYYLLGDGASPEGDRPFVDRVDLADGKATRQFRSEAP